MTKRIVVTGAGGRLGAALSAELVSAGHNVTGLSRTDLDVTDGEQVASVMRHLRPEVIVNCSAYNAVDTAESDPAAAFAANAEGPSFLADAAEATEALLIHYSTDFVFDGRTLEPYSEDAPANPLGVYGASKLAGEHEVRRARRHYILRVESLFGGRGANGHRATVDQITDSLLASREVRALVDRTVSPSYVNDVVRATIGLIEREAPYGTYHCVNSGFTTWYELANAVAHELGIAAAIAPVMSADLKTTAPRPVFCALSNRKLVGFGIDMPSWQSAIRCHLTSRRSRSAVGAPQR